MGVNDHDTFSGLAPLHVAAKDGDLKKLVEIMDDGADVNIRACGEVRVGSTTEGVTHKRAGVSTLDGTMGDARGGGGEATECWNDERDRADLGARSRDGARFAGGKSE